MVSTSHGRYSNCVAKQKMKCMWTEAVKNSCCSAIMMISSMETFSALLALCEGNPPVTGAFLSERPVTWIFDVFFDLRPNKRLSKQSTRRWFETPPRHYDVIVMILSIFWCVLVVFRDGILTWKRIPHYQPFVSVNHRLVIGWFPYQRASDLEHWYFPCLYPKQAVNQTAKLLVIWHS